MNEKLADCQRQIGFKVQVVEKVSLVIWLDEIGECLPMVMGNKDAILARMRRAGYPMPPGFVVTTQAFQQFLTTQVLSENATAEDRQLILSRVLKRWLSIVVFGYLPPDLPRGT